MENILTEYQKWKQQGEALRAEARLAMETRFQQLLTEAVGLARDYQADFGVAIKLPSDVTEFRFKAGTGAAKAGPGAPKNAGRPKATKTAPEPEPPTAPAPPNPKIPGLEKRLATAVAKVEAAKAAGKPSRNLEDKVYEIEDELRLARGA